MKQRVIVKVPIPLERVITDGIVKWLRENGYSFTVKIHGASYQSAGLPDIITIDKRGRFVGLEVKRPQIGTVTELQKRMLWKINESGGYGVVVRSLEGVKAAMAASEDRAVAFEIDPEGKPEKR